MVALAAPGGGTPVRIGVAPAVPVRSADAAAALDGPARGLRQAIRVELRRMRAARRASLRHQSGQSFATLPGGVSRATLNAIAACESGGNPAAVSPGGAYRGKYQFDQGTWESVGGHGDPATAPEAEQDYRAALLYARAGPSPWPVCG